MNEIMVPASDKVQAGYEKLKACWEDAMSTLPEFLRIKMNVNQIHAIPEYSAEADRVLHQERVRLGASSASHTVAFRDGRLMHCITV